MSLFWGTEASRTIVGNDWQLSFLREFLEQGFTTSDKWSDYSKIALVDCVICFHSSQVSVMEARHDKRLGQVIQVLSHGNHIITILSCTRVDHSSFHS